MFDRALGITPNRSVSGLSPTLNICPKSKSPPFVDCSKRCSIPFHVWPPMNADKCRSWGESLPPPNRLSTRFTPPADC